MAYKDRLKRNELARKYHYNRYHSDLAYRQKKLETEKSNRINGKQKAKYEARKAILREYKKGGCIVCGEKEPTCLDFHHYKGEKEMIISKMAVGGFAVHRLVNELEKCIILCANCHRKYHNGVITLPMLGSSSAERRIHGPQAASSILAPANDQIEIEWGKEYEPVN